MRDDTERPDLLIHLPPLPSDPHAGSGWDWMGNLHRWAPIPGWGQDGWDLGEWPYAIVCTCAVRGPGKAMVYGVATYTEGDVAVAAYADHHDRVRAIDELALAGWRRRDSGPGRASLGWSGPVREHHTGPFLWDRIGLPELAEEGS
jgi:hypothetical protein